MIINDGKNVKIIHLFMPTGSIYYNYLLRKNLRRGCWRRAIIELLGNMVSQRICGSSVFDTFAHETTKAGVFAQGVDFLDGRVLQ